MSPITPPPELVSKWASEWMQLQNVNRDNFMATRAAQWGADQELEACCHWLKDVDEVADELRFARRPKPPSLKEQAYAALDAYVYGNPDHGDKQNTYNTIRRALEQLDD